MFQLPDASYFFHSKAKVFTELPLEDYKNRICGSKILFSSAEQPHKKMSIRLTLVSRKLVTFTAEPVTAQFISLVALADE